MITLTPSTNQALKLIFHDLTSRSPTPAPLIIPLQAALGETIRAHNP